MTHPGTLLPARQRALQGIAPERLTAALDGSVIPDLTSTIRMYSRAAEFATPAAADRSARSPGGQMRSVPFWQGWALHLTISSAKLWVAPKSEAGLHDLGERFTAVAAGAVIVSDRCR